MCACFNVNVMTKAANAIMLNEKQMIEKRTNTKLHASLMFLNNRISNRNVEDPSKKAENCDRKYFKIA